MLYFLITAAFLMVGTGMAQADLIVNGDFETGDFTGWTPSGNVVVGSDAQFRTLGGGVGTFLKGTYAVDFGGGNGPDTGVLTQNFITTPAQEYNLSFDFGRFMSGSGGPQSLRVEVINVADNHDLLDTVLTDTSGQSNLALLFNNFSFRFFATGSTTQLSFRDVSLGSFETDSALDNVGVTTVLPSVPEPASLVLLSTGILILLWYNRRRFYCNE